MKGGVHSVRQTSEVTKRLDMKSEILTKQESKGRMGNIH